MKQSRRIRVFGVGFLAGCVLAAGIAFLRVATDESVEEPPLPAWRSASEPVPSPSLPFPASVVKVWTTAEEPLEIRWMVATPEKDLWRAAEGPAGSSLVRADRIAVLANPGIDPPALRAGLEHNGFEILSFNPAETRFVVAVNPFEPDAIERAIRLLRQRRPYIFDAEPVPYIGTSISDPGGDLD
ncbi:MAG: hypothetical protein ACLFRP_00280 [Puniceicoccaceae bacterium]